uniref:Citrate transporter-like domain-containing protein n=1 Tax=Guillardia theta (strain CCMP2712) TaxID=905079 RepID=A0A0C3T240_GUITC
MVLTFVVGYLSIIFEETLDVNKSAIAIAMGMMCWCLVGHATGLGSEQVLKALSESFSGVSQIVFFLIGAMTIVETIDAHKGFSIVTEKIQTNDKRLLAVIVSFVTFFMSSVLDNLTTTIVMCSVLGKLLPPNEKETRRLLGGLAVIAANAGGACKAFLPCSSLTYLFLPPPHSPPAPAIIVIFFFLPLLYFLVLFLFLLHLSSLFSLLSSLFSLLSSLFSKKAVGVGGLLFVPVFKTLSHLPPFAGMLLATSAVWAITDRLHGNDRPELKVPEALRRIDMSGAIFFLGILMAVSALESAGVLVKVAQLLGQVVPDNNIVAMIIGVVSAVIDNVPLVAAAMGMYDLSIIPTDSQFWDLIAFSDIQLAGTGGSMLVIGSAAGIAFMGMENISFLWYLKKIAPGAAMGYVAGIITLLIQTK